MKLLCVFGPTACHKSETALSLAQELDGEILSCDSVAVYRGFDIGSAKPTKEEQAKIPHHLIDIVDRGGAQRTVERRGIRGEGHAHRG